MGLRSGHPHRTDPRLVAHGHVLRRLSGPDLVPAAAGLFSADVLYYYGDQGYNFVLAKHVDPSLGPGYDYDVTNEDVLMNRLAVANGKLRLPDGMSYEVLALPDRNDIDLPVLEHLETLVRGGATVVGPKPEHATGFFDYPGRDRSVRDLAAKMWGDCDGKRVVKHRYGSGTVVCGQTLRQVLAERGVGPDFTYHGRQPDADVDFVHRSTPDAEIYFLRNKKSRWEEIDAQFRVHDRVPEFWLPDTGAVMPALLYTNAASGTTLPLQLPPEGSLFVVFRKEPGRAHILSRRRGAQPVRAENPYPEVSWTGEEQLTAFQPGAYTLAMSKGKA